MFFPLNNHSTFFLELKLFTEYSASFPFFKGPLRYGYFTLCLLCYEYLRYALQRYAFLPCAFLRYASLRYSSLRFGYLRYAFLRYAFLPCAFLRYASFRDGHLQNRLVAIQLWIDAFMIWTILFQIMIIEFCRRYTSIVCISSIVFTFVVCDA